MSLHDSHLENLIVRHLGGELNAEEERQLAAELAESEVARALFASYLRMEGAISELGTAGCLTADPATVGEAMPTLAAITPPSPRAQRQTRWPLAFAAAAAVALIAFGTYAVRNWQPDEGLVFAGDGVTAVAELIRTVNVDWRHTGMPTTVGSALPPGLLSLGSGLVEITFLDGATVILEGPADLELISTDQAYLHRGRLRGSVPHDNSALTISTSDLTVADPGVDFGVRVDDTGSAELHVFDGEVKLEDAKSSVADDVQRVISAGTAVRVDATGSRVVMDADENSFVGAGMLTVVAESHVKDLKTELKAFKRRETELSRGRRQAIDRISQSPELLELKDRLERASQQLADFLAQNPSIDDAEKAVRQAQTALQLALDENIAASEDGRRLLAEIQRFDTQFKKGRQSSHIRTGINRNRSAKFNRQNDLKARGKAVAQLQELQQQLKQSDPQLRRLAEEFRVARKTVRDLSARTEYRQLRKEVSAAKKSRNATRARLLREDNVLRSLQAELKMLQTRLQRIKKEIRDSRDDRVL